MEVEETHPENVQRDEAAMFSTESYLVPPFTHTFLNFFTLTMTALGAHCSSQKLNDVMSEIECAQLHSELFRCRHSTWQSHGFFALAKHLLKIQDGERPPF